MICKWEIRQERVKRYLRITPEKKMEWLRQMQEFALKTSSKNTMAIRKKLRAKR